MTGFALAGNAFVFIARALRELYKDPAFLAGCLLALILAATMVSAIAVGLQFEAREPQLASWFFRACVDITVVGIDFCVFQHILGHYRKISLTWRTVPLCLGWSAFFLLVGIVLEHASHLLDEALAWDFHPGLYDYFHHLIVNIAVAGAMIRIGFYPFLILQQSVRLWDENRTLVRTTGFSLFIGWIVVWYVTWCLGKLIETGMLGILTASHADNNPPLYAFALYMKDFLIYAVFILPAAATTTVAFLHGTGETGFSDSRRHRTRRKK